MDIANVEAVKWYAVRLRGSALGGAGLAILFCFSELGNDRNAEEFLSCKSNGLLYRFFFFELNVANTAI